MFSAILILSDGDEIKFEEMRRRRLQELMHDDDFVVGSYKPRYEALEKEMTVVPSAKATDLETSTGKCNGGGTSTPSLTNQSDSGKGDVCTEESSTLMSMPDSSCTSFLIVRTSESPGR